MRMYFMRIGSYPWLIVERKYMLSVFYLKSNKDSRYWTKLRKSDSSNFSIVALTHILITIKYLY